MRERVAIIGTAQSWTLTPWNDPGLHLVSLNDAYRMKGFVRADAWYDLHPLNKFVAVPEGATQIYAHQVPPGHYVRPAPHLDWLSKQSIPVWLSRPEDHTPPETYELPTWPHLHVFPKREIEAAYGQYFTSSPAWMLAQLILDGAREVHIYGIHLATEHEYIEQRPNFEFLCGCVLGPGKRTERRSGGLRWYESAQGTIVLPEASPILASDFQYAFQPRPRAHLEPIRWDLHRFGVKKERALTALRQKPWYRPSKPITDELNRLDAQLTIAQQQMQALQLTQELAR